MLLFFYMLKCPRCGFEQPEDVFCASCGVNMQNYAAKHSRPKIAIYVLVAAFVLLLGLVINKLSDFMDKASQQTQMLSEAMDPSQSTPPMAVPPPQKPVTPQKNEVTREKVSRPSIPEAPETVAFAQAATPATPSYKISNQMSVEFALVPKEAMGKLSLAVGQPSSNLIPKIKFEEASKESGWQSLSTETHHLGQGHTASVTQGSQEPRTKEYIGFMMKITPSRTSDASADYRIQIKRNLPLFSGANDIKISSEDFSENITIAAGQVFAISGLLPRKTLMENEDQLYTTNILRAFLEPGFQKYDQEFVIFFNP